MNKFCCLLMMLLLSPELALAQAVSDSVPFSAEPDRQWIVGLYSNDLWLQRADLVKTPDELHLSAVFSDLPSDALIAGVVQFQDGVVRSMPLHRVAEAHLPRESTKVAQRRIAEISAQLTGLQKRKATLTDEAARLKHSLRHEAGLDEVDRLYDRIAALEERLKELGVAVDSD